MNRRRMYQQISAREIINDYLSDEAKEIEKGEIEMMGKREIVIVAIDEEKISFDDGSYISWFHYQDCSENTYADLYQIMDCIGMKFKAPLEFEKADDYGFRFGNGINMIFVPCYSEQNGYYSAAVNVVYYDAATETECEYIYEGKHLYRDGNVYEDKYGNFHEED